MGDIEKFTDAVTWSQKIKLVDDPNIVPVIKGRLDYQVCDDRGCRPLKAEFSYSTAGSAAVVPVGGEDQPGTPKAAPDSETRVAPETDGRTISVSKGFSRSFPRRSSPGWRCDDPLRLSHGPDHGQLFRSNPRLTSPPGHDGVRLLH